MAQSEAKQVIELLLQNNVVFTYLPMVKNTGILTVSRFSDSNYALCDIEEKIKKITRNSSDGIYYWRYVEEKPL